MTSKERKQLGILGALVAVFLVVVFVVSRGEGPTAGGRQPSNPAAARKQQAPPDVADVRLEALQQERDEPAGPQRNLFAFREKPAPPPPPREPVQPADVAPPVPSGPPPPPPIPLKFIGVLEPPGGKGKVAILSDGRGNTFSAREGEDVDGRYRVLRIGTESVELSYVDGRSRQTLRLSGQ